MVEEEDPAHFFAVKNRPPRDLPNCGAGKNVQKVIPATGDKQIETIGATGSEDQGEQKEQDKGLVMNLPEDVRQKEVKCEKKGKNDRKKAKKPSFLAKTKQNRQGQQEGQSVRCGKSKRMIDHPAGNTRCDERQLGQIPVIIEKNGVILG